MENKNPKELRIVFMGTPEFATESLRKLHEDNYNIVGVITVPDKKAGRGQKIRQSDVKKYATANNIPVLQPEKLKSTEFLKSLKQLQPDLNIVVAFRMLPEEVWAMPKLGTFNLHASLLPNYRGAAPINHAIINGEKETGVTTFFIDKKIDTGHILLQEKTLISDNETAGELHDKLMRIGSELVKKTVNIIANNQANVIPQAELITDFEKIKDAPKIFKEDCKIDWSQSIDKIHNQIRGLSPYPAAFTEIISQENESYQIKIYKSKIIKGKASEKDYKVTSSDEKELIIYLPDGYIAIQEIQLSGKRRMPTKDFLLGFPIDGEWRVNKN